MPKVIDIRGYKIFFYSNENNEPPHVHISKNQHSSSKIWLEPLKIEHNNAKIPKNDLAKILYWLEDNHEKVLSAWYEHFKS